MPPSSTIAEFVPGVDRSRPSKVGKQEAFTYRLFFETHIKHTDNKYFGKPFILDDWQYNDIFLPLFGQGHMIKAGSERVFKRSKRILVEGVPRSGGKSDLACGLLLTIASMEPVYNGEYAVIAYSKDQARKDFGKLKTMIRLDPELKAMWKPLTDSIINEETGAKIMVMPYSENALQSWHLNVAVLDEVHTYKDDELYNAVISGQRDIFNAVCIIITTAAGSRKGFLWDQLPKWQKSRDAHVAWYGAKDSEDLDDEKMWKRVHPMSWVSVEDVRRQRENLSNKQFERYEVNRFPLEKSEDKALKVGEVRRCQRIENLFDFNQPFILGVDGATSGDSFAIVAHQVNNGIDCYHEWVFDEPGESGYYDLNQIEELIAYLSQKHHCPVGIDPNRLLLMAQQLQDDFGVEIFEVPQNNKIMCAASEMVARSVKEKRTSLDGCPKLAEHLTNCIQLTREPFGWRFSSEKHGQGTDRIDAAIAAAIAKYSTTTVGPTVSFVESGGIWTV